MTLETVAAATVFESYGNFDWHSDFAALGGRAPAEQLAMEPLIADEGDSPDGTVPGSLRLCADEPAARPRAPHRGVSRQGAGVRPGRARGALRTGPRCGGGIRCGPWVTWMCCEFRPKSCWRQFCRIAKCKLRTCPQPARGNFRSEIGVEDDVARTSGIGGSVREPAINPRLLDFLVDHRFLNGTADDVDRSRSLHPLRRLRASMCGHARQQPALRPPGAGA